jgi:hypothetical protein
MAYAAYCAHAGLQFTAFLPAIVPRVKADFIRYCGAAQCGIAHDPFVFVKGNFGAITGSATHPL